MEEDAVARAAVPGTVRGMVAQLATLGLPTGATVIVHSSLSQLGWVAGGPQAVVTALLEAVGPAGTLVMPTHSRQLTEPADWGNPAVPQSWWDVIRSETPAFDPRTTPTYFMGAVVECFRRFPGVLRSDHPTVSFAACGPDAGRITAGHTLHDGLGEGSPLARLYEADAWVLLLGVGHDNNTSLHLAEYRAALPAEKPRLRQGSPVLVDGERRWVEYTELADDTSLFEPLGKDFAAITGLERVGPVGSGTARLMRQRALVDFGAMWLSRRFSS
ncbi:aminoglycoside N(3)-acetyltransferase [Dactylosporangium siamense]|uniref:Aminoglycoside N(3)-acetyltransferase n=1 Tax=Dactylosporangium siamense TaxID=685454 RepID=A0A919PQ51_9ACTN|nr:AAC(3) family N-acetyltransferase [Dactylosporangium siamense]GIG46263.1 AAC(3) family N-acetyltransferase [Dactylosporangium siamense]